MVGDTLIAINGRSLEGLSQEQVRALAAGRNGSRVTLQLAPDKSNPNDERPIHPASRTLTVELEREPDFSPPWAQEDPARPIPREEGPAKWRYVAEQTAAWRALGFNLSDFGLWEARADPRTGRRVYVDALTNHTRPDRPADLDRCERIRQLPPARAAEEFYRTAAPFLNSNPLLPTTEPMPRAPLPLPDDPDPAPAPALPAPAPLVPPSGSGPPAEDAGERALRELADGMQAARFRRRAAAVGEAAAAAGLAAAPAKVRRRLWGSCWPPEDGDTNNRQMIVK